MHLLITSADDVTSDLICERLERNVFRLNWERWNDYIVEVYEPGFRLADGYGREVTESTIGNVIWRKPIRTIDTEPGEVWYCFHEFKYAVESILEWLREANPRRIPIDPIRNSATDKFKQLRVAGRHLPVPEWRFTCEPSRLSPDDGSWVVKSVTGQPIPGTGDFSKVIYTTQVEPAELSDGFPWFLQRCIEAAYDLTVVFVDGQQFAFTLDRRLFPGIDWRQSIGTKAVDDSWQPVGIPSNLRASLSSIMRDLGLRFGRFDLLTNDLTCEDVWFLEVNPNGQWAWLDHQLENGLFDAVVSFLVSQ